MRPKRVISTDRQAVDTPTARFSSSSTRARASGRILVAILATAASWNCGGPSLAPSRIIELPFVTESSSMRYFYEPGDTVNVARQDAFNAWALDRLRVVPPQKLEYRKYWSRQAMAAYTGTGNANAYADPQRFTIHTIFPYDNHEVVHVYTSLIGRPSDFFNEGIAVSFQTDPQANDFSVVFNGIEVHAASSGYLRAGTLPHPLSRYITTPGFRALPDEIMAYRLAGSFVLFLQQRFDLARVLSFFSQSGNGRDDPLDVIRLKFQQSFGITVDDAEAEWLAMLSGMQERAQP